MSLASLGAGEQQRLGRIRPELRRNLLALREAAYAQLGFTLVVPDDGGTRSLERQQALYADSIAQGGGTLAYPVGRPGKSRHNFGAGVDLHIVGGGSARDGSGTDDDYAQLAELAESLPGAPGLVAGYYFADRGVAQSDPFHFQLDEPLATSQAAWAAMQDESGVKNMAIAAGVVLGLFWLAR